MKFEEILSKNQIEILKSIGFDTKKEITKFSIELAAKLIEHSKRELERIDIILDKQYENAN